jgi:hypothetical protein
MGQKPSLVSSTNAKTIAEYDGGTFNKNQNAFPPEELIKYAGQRVAWSLDGTRILASGADEAELLNNLRRAGIDPSQVVQAAVEPMDGIAHL